jgi:hypothetical protein
LDLLVVAGLFLGVWLGTLLLAELVYAIAVRVYAWYFAHEVAKELRESDQQGGVPRL